MKIEEFEALCERDDDGTIYVSSLIKNHGFTIVDDGDWIESHKYSIKDAVVKSEDGTYFNLCEVKSCDFYEPTVVTEVFPKVITTVIYVPESDL